MGDRAICRLCGIEIEYVGPYWRHTQWNGRHPGEPEDAAGVTTLRCADCGLPFARIEDGELVVESRHHGEKHVNRVAVAELVRLADGGKREA